MMDSGSDLIQELYCKMTYQGMRPKTIVDYTREPFIYEAGNVRVTFDYNIRTGLWVTDFLNPDCVTIPAGDYSPIILEVKWDEYLPSIIRDCVQTPGRHVTAFSKYAQCRLYGYNAIFNMAVTMQDNGDSTKLFVDAFTGGGKMGLSMPHGWFDTIVINDLDYGVASYYRCAKDDYRKLLATINRLIDGMTEELYFVSLLARENREIDPLVAGAMTYLTAALSFNNIIDYDSANYKPIMGDKSEKEELDKVRARAQRTIQAVHNKLNSQEYIIENLDYRELIKKYNGLPFSNMDAIESYAGNERNILWYFDPPYYMYCLAGTDAAPYANSFGEEDTIAMTKVLSGEDKSCGELIYFIKSDYNPKETMRNAELALKSNKKKSQSETDTYKEVIKNKDKMMHVFDSIEKAPFYAFSVGKFDKGAIKSDGSVSVGNEWIWTKGLPNDYDTLK